MKMPQKEKMKLARQLQAENNADLVTCMAAVERCQSLEDAIAVVQYFTPGHPNYLVRPACLDGVLG